MMKKFVTGIFILLYSFAASGATLQFHYCMDRLAEWSVSFNQPEDNSCGFCGMEDKKDNGCCKDISEKISVDDEQKLSVRQFLNKAAEINCSIPLSLFSQTLQITPLTLDNFYQSGTIPDQEGRRLVRLRSFRI